MNQKPASTPTTQRPITIIINGNSRQGREAFPLVQQALQAAGVPLGEAILSKHEDETVDILRREIEQDAQTVIIGGGDGTLSQCASILVGSSVAMAVLPLGTGNTLARSLGIPLDLEAAAQAIAQGHAETINVGRVNGRVFVNSVTLGLSATIAHALDGDLKKRLGIFSWPIIGVKALWKHRALYLGITAEERQIETRTHQIVISNGRYIAGPVRAAPDASLQDDSLRVFTLGNAGHWSLLKLTVLWIMGHHKDVPEANYFTTHKVRIESLRGPIAADVDGEINESTPLEIEFVPRALRVIVPQGFEAENV